MKSRSLTSEQIQSAGTQAQAWFITTQDLITPDASLNPRYAFQILVGLWISEQGILEDQRYPCSSTYAATIGQYLPEDTDDALNFLYSDPALALFSLGILRFFDIHNEQLELFAQKISELLHNHTDQNEDEASELFLVRFLLRRLNLHSRLSSYTLRKVDPITLIHADDSVISKLVKNITAATHYGQMTRSIEPDMRASLSSLLPILVLDSFRAYQLEEGMQLLRCMRYLHIHEKNDRIDSLPFLLAQQQPDGRFGFLADEIQKIESTDQPASADLSIYLPLTVSFLWTIAEVAHPQFILAQSF